MKPSAIFCADLHIREDQPECRTDNYFETQKRKLQFLFNYSVEYQIPIYCAGDLFHKARSSKELEIFLMNRMAGLTIAAIPGNHDLPNHNVEKINDSSIGILWNSGSITCSKMPLEKIEKYIVPYKNKHRTIGLVHKLIHAYDPITVGKDIISYSAKKVLLDNPEYDVIVSGDNHQTFVFEYNGKLLVNPGSMMRMTAAQMDHKPCFFFYYAEEHEIRPIYWKIDNDVITREHIEKEHKKEERFNAYIERMNNNYELSLSFKNNLKSYMKINETRKSVEDIIWEVVNE